MLLKEPKLDPRVKRTRESLVQAFSELIKKKDFALITVQEITEHAQINRATFYAHFEDKYTLLNYTVQELFQETLDTRLGQKLGFTYEHLRALTLATCEFMGEFHDHCAPSKRNNHPPFEQQVHIRMYEVLLDWIKNTELVDTEQSSEIIAMVTSWIIFGSALQWSRGDRRLSAEALTKQIMPLMTKGLVSVLL